MVSIFESLKLWLSQGQMSIMRLNLLDLSSLINQSLISSSTTGLNECLKCFFPSVDMSFPDIQDTFQDKQSGINLNLPNSGSGLHSPDLNPIENH